jgi:ankyrin repeat protein
MQRIRRWLRQEPDRKSPERAALYVHLRADLGIFSVKGTGAQGLLTEQQLLAEVSRIVGAGGLVLYSRDDPSRDPPEEVDRVFRSIVALHPRIQLMMEPHPDASSPPGGATTLMQAAHFGDVEVVTDLIRRGAAVDGRDIDGYSALMYAAQRGQVGTARALVEAGAPVDAFDEEGNTALMFAAQGGHELVIDLLLAAGADITPRGRGGLSALDFARQNGHRSLLLRLAPPGE